MSSPHPSVLFYNRLASMTDIPGEAYDKEWATRLPGHTILTTLIGGLVASLPHAVHQVLDLGCGTGIASAAALPRCAYGAQVTLVDAAPSMLMAAQDRLGNRVFNAYTCDFTSDDADVFRLQAYDLALCTYALTHLDDQAKRVTLERLASTLVPGGLLIVIDQVVSDRPGGWDAVDTLNRRTVAALIDAKRMPNTADIEPQEVHLARIDDMTSWMARGGLAVACPAQWLGSALLLGLRPGSV